jgi:hypothetical protein
MKYLSKDGLKFLFIFAVLGLLGWHTWELRPWREEPVANTSDQEAVWEQMFTCRFNARYHELAGCPEIQKRYQAVVAKYKALYDEDAPEVDQAILDGLYLERCKIEADEPPVPDMKLIHQAYDDVCRDVANGVWPCKCRNGDFCIVCEPAMIAEMRRVAKLPVCPKCHVSVNMCGCRRFDRNNETAGGVR